MDDFFSVSPAGQLQRLETAARAALCRWEVEGAALELIKHRENAVFRVEQGGRKAALRVHRYGYHTDDELRSELQWMQALSNAGVLVPNVIPADSGELFITHSGEGLPGDMQIDLFEWIDGMQLGSVEGGIDNDGNVETTYQSIGELAARVHNQAVTWKLPRGFTRHAWDAAGLAGLKPFWGRFWKLENATRSEKKLLERARDRVFADLNRLPKSPGTYSMIHADFAPENVMVHGDEVRLIDFDDCGFGWHLFELATSLYFIRGEPWFERAKKALITGYRKHRQLTDKELERLPLHFLARSLTYVGWVHTRQETETARELTPMLLASACELADAYLMN